MCAAHPNCPRPVVRDLSGAPHPSGACWFHVRGESARYLVDTAPLGSAPDWRYSATPYVEPDRGLIFGRTWSQIDAMQRGGRS